MFASILEISCVLLFAQGNALPRRLFQYLETLILGLGSLRLMLHTVSLSDLGIHVWKFIDLGFNLNR